MSDTDSRMDAIRLKQMLGGRLTDQELMCLQIDEHGFGCSGGRLPLVVAIQTRG